MATTPVPTARPQAVFVPQPKPTTIAMALPPATVAALNEMYAR